MQDTRTSGATQGQQSGCFALRILAISEDNRMKIASLGGIETELHAMSAHPRDMNVQENGCFALVSLAMHDDNLPKIVSLCGIETVLHAMSVHLVAALVQESCCFALRILDANEDNHANFAPPLAASRRCCMR